jgi:hypothetical protein
VRDGTGERSWKREGERESFEGLDHLQDGRVCGRVCNASGVGNHVNGHELT